MGDKDGCEAERRTEDGVNFHSSNTSRSWQLSNANLANASVGMIPNCNPVVDSFCFAIWDNQPNSVNVGFCDANLHTNVSSSSLLGAGTIDFEPSRSGVNGTFGMVWNPPNGMFKGSLLPPAVPGIVPQSLPPFQVDSDFIERAARFSCFSGGNLGDVMNHFNTLECVNAHYKGLAPFQSPQEVSVGNGLKSEPVTQSQKHQITSVAESSKEESLYIGSNFTEGSPQQKDEKNESIVRSQKGAKQGTRVSEIESDKLKCSGHCSQEVSESAVAQSSAKELGSKKRKRSGQGAKLDQKKGTPSQPVEAANDQTEIQQKGDQNVTSTASKQGGENGKQGPQTSEPPKEEYIHVRARRGQATNTHSLAERVRREKISERMKLLQDLVPGCNKVIGKAVMLDEIINYVQSLQRQVEFLSMKLATINPMLDFNTDVLFANDIFRADSSSLLAFPPDMAMPYPPMHPSKRVLIQGGPPDLGNSTAALHRTINSQLANTSEPYKDPTSKVCNTWDDALHNVFQMGFNSSAAPLSNQYRSSLPPGHMKTKP